MIFVIVVVVALIITLYTRIVLLSSKLYIFPFVHSEVVQRLNFATDWEELLLMWPLRVGTRHAQTFCTR